MISHFLAFVSIFSFPEKAAIAVISGYFHFLVIDLPFSGHSDSFMDGHMTQAHPIRFFLWECSLAAGGDNCLF